MQRIQRYAKVHVERHKVPTREEVEGKRADTYFELLRATMEEGNYKNHEDTVQRLLDAGHEPTQICSALMHCGSEIRVGRVRKSWRTVRVQKKASVGHGIRRGGGDRGPRERAPREYGPAGNDDRRPPRREHRADAAPSRTTLACSSMWERWMEPHRVRVRVRFIGRASCLRGTVGKIDIYAKCSFVLVQNDFVETAMERIGSTKLHGRNLRMDVAK
jgi:ATP-dependent RNA helicase DeaD